MSTEFRGHCAPVTTRGIAVRVDDTPVHVDDDELGRAVDQRVVSRFTLAERLLGPLRSEMSSTVTRMPATAPVSSRHGALDQSIQRCVPSPCQSQSSRSRVCSPARPRRCASLQRSGMGGARSVRAEAGGSARPSARSSIQRWLVAT